MHATTSAAVTAAPPAPVPLDSYRRGATAADDIAPPDATAESAMKRTGFEITAGMLIGRVLDGRILPAQCRQLLVMTAQSASAGLTVQSVGQAVTRAMERAVRGVESDPRAEGARRARHGWNLDSLRQDLVTATTAAVAQARSDETARTTPVRSLAALLAASRDAGEEPVTQSYVVLAVALPPHRDELPADTADDAARQKVARLRQELEQRCAGRVVSTLTEHGGTIVIESGTEPDPPHGDLIAALSGAADVPVTATLIHAVGADIPNATDRAHELLDVIQRMGYGPGLHLFDDLALEYQLTRPGPGLDRLKTVLEPLEDHPRLLQTLVIHIAANLSRQHTASVMKVHRNTIDYRLRRIQELTGYDPSRPPGIWYLQAALIIRSFGQAGTGTGRPAGLPGMAPMKNVVGQ
ncbi:putative transcriptional regulator [Nocardia nova SH22a]|uniref:Putative transcriptional regulator n=1 Tax=Nocardia nova SH22a TaxID=1415166 RepID=W5TKT5_9NOCA|nr:helix-turn-helix domain-containing protein [Nocardia nova]AHH19583.1 putative transcriptional regulator [Nocardia nova SH22a]